MLLSATVLRPEIINVSWFLTLPVISFIICQKVASTATTPYTSVQEHGLRRYISEKGKERKENGVQRLS
jgi:hypothetical protein